MFLELIRTLRDFYTTADKSIFNSIKPGAPNPSLFRIMGTCFVSIQSGANHYCTERKLTYPKIIIDNLNAYVQEKRNEIDSFLDDKYLIDLPSGFNITQLSDREKLPYRLIYESL